MRKVGHLPLDIDRQLFDPEITLFSSGRSSVTFSLQSALQSAEASIRFDYSLKLKQLVEFDYSPDQWHEIEHAVKKGRSAPLNDFERSRIARAGKLYCLTFSRSAKTEEAYRRKSWADVAKLSDKLAAALSAATGTTNVFTPKDIKLSFKLSSERLAKLKAEAEIYSRPREVKKPKAKFYKEILSIWTELLGCKLGRSTNSANERYGPCVRYFCSVARPVMGSAAPSEKYIPDLIDEEKKRRKDQ